MEKMDKAERLKRAPAPKARISPELAHRLPPGQTLTDRFPILHEGDVPDYGDGSGMVAARVRPGGRGADVQPGRSEGDAARDRRLRHSLRTRWSKFDTAWEGVRFRDFLAAAGIRVRQEARHVMIHADQDYETNVPLEDLMGDDVLLAWGYDGKPLTPKHGWPLRLIVPHLYFWKSAKWVRASSS